MIDSDAHYAVMIWGDVDPYTYGPFGTEEEVDDKIRTLREKEGDHHGYFWIHLQEDGKLTMGDYPSSFFEEDE